MNDAPIIYRYGLRYPHEGDKAIIVDMATNEVMFKGDIVARLNELETQLATEREAKMHETERAQTLMQERNKWKAFESSTAKILEHTRKERDAARQSRKRLVEFVRYRARELENADEFIRDIEAERDTAREEMKQAQARAGAYLYRAERAEQDAREMFDAIDAYLTEKKRLANGAGYVLAEGTPDPHTLALSKLADMRIKHGAKYGKDGEQT